MQSQVCDVTEKQQAPRGPKQPKPLFFSFSIIRFFSVRSRLLCALVDAGQSHVRAGDHGAQEETRRGHPRRGLPPLSTLHRERRCRRAGQDLRLIFLTGKYA